MVEITSEIKKMIEENPIAFATVGASGKPNVIAVAFVKVVAKNQILITDNHMKQTNVNIEKNNNVCLVVWDKSWTGYKLVGEAKYFTRGKFYKMARALLENANEPRKGAILVK